MALIKFELTTDHINLVRYLTIETIHNGLNGIVEDAIKSSPWGGDNIYDDMALILDGKVSDIDISDLGHIEHNLDKIEYWNRLITELPTAVWVILSTQNYNSGIYTRKSYDNTWSLKTK